MVGLATEDAQPLLAINEEANDRLYASNLQALAQRLDQVRLGISPAHCVECSIRLMQEIEGELAFIRVNHPKTRKFAGWIVQLSSSEYSSFVLASVEEPSSIQHGATTMVELLSCTDTFDSRCILSHFDAVEWLHNELSGRSTADRFRWIDLSIALKELC